MTLERGACGAVPGSVSPIRCSEWRCRGRKASLVAVCSHVPQRRCRRVTAAKPRPKLSRRVGPWSPRRARAHRGRAADPTAGRDRSPGAPLVKLSRSDSRRTSAPAYSRKLECLHRDLAPLVEYSARPHGVALSVRPRVARASGGSSDQHANTRPGSGLSHSQAGVRRIRESRDGSLLSGRSCAAAKAVRKASQSSCCPLFEM
jgi:hypothetical protein